MTSKTDFTTIACFASALLTGAMAFGQAEQALSTENVQFFEAKIRPVLVEHCYRCHSADGQGIRGGLSVENKDAMLAGGESGPAIVPGNLAESNLWSAINYIDFKMPPKNPLPRAVIEDFRKWIEMGATDPRVSSGVVIHSKVTPEDIATGKEFWSFKAPVKTEPKVSQHTSWAKTDIDRHVAQSWDERGLEPANDAEPATVARRLYFDLIGLPPSVKEVDVFLASWKNNPESAISQTADDLLKRPQFGERWGRYWLDIARYAESSGKEVDMTFPNAWRYRNYVIDSFNNDKPYDQFVREQIAGDLIPTKDDRQFAEQLIATGFLAIGPKTLTERNPRQFQADLIDEQIDTTTRVILGVSVACARCHDHKFDPIPQSDYYALAGIFQSTETMFGGLRSQRSRQESNLIILPLNDPNPNDKPLSKTELAGLKKQLAEREKDYADARRAQRQPEKNKDGVAPRSSFLSIAILDQMVAQISSRINTVDSDGNPMTLCMGVQAVDRPRDAKLLVRGEIDQPAQEVKRGFVQVLCKEQVKLPSNSTGRREFAEWLSAYENPLTARVMVNRVWQHLIGKAIVSEPDNFGASGPAPSNPALLDYLAVDFMDNKWSVKHIVRSIVTSRAYRLSSAYDKARFEADPENSFVSRANVRRLDAEAIRDAILSISGQIEMSRPKASLIASFGTTLIGPNGPVSIPPVALSMGAGAQSGTIPSRPGLKGIRGARASSLSPLEAPNYSRSVYLPIARNSLPRALDVFDFAEPSLVVGSRETSNTADQALFLLNNPFMLEQSDAIARQLIRSSSNQSERIARAFSLVYGRTATQKELRTAADFFRRADDGKKIAAEQKVFQALSQFCQALLCSAEFRLIN
ncbi:MAG TPA: PSD1 and planctomycete cytochrome C domain-containing protein [Pirellula sp.]|nr:PSD1 and planctomycete cytochrome C domain-containing protein [Pirellula sp.]